MANTPNYDIDYNDERFTKVESDKQAALSEVEQTYGGMISDADKYYQGLIDANKQWADTQSKLQQDRTDFAVEQINQQKDQAKKDYTKEQSGAYVDWQKQSNQYGANSEKIAAGGLAKTGFAESSQVSMYNTYQNRVATAREAYTRAILNYDNAIKDARLQNNSALAEIAYQALQKELELSLAGFQYKNTLIIEKANKKQEVENTYYGRYQDVLQQINTENALAEQIRQYEQDYAEGVRQFNEEQARLKANAELEYALEQQKLEIQKAQQEALVIKGNDEENGGKATNNKSREETKTGDKKALEVSTPTTYSGAVAYMKTFGVDGAKASSVMTESEWKRRKSSYNAKGVGSAAVSVNNSYQEYLEDYCNYAISTK